MALAVLPRATSTTGPDVLFYDGGCGLCHRAVRFVLWADPEGRAFRFAPLGGATFEAKVPASARAGLPDSMVVQTAEGVLLVRSAGVLHMLRRLGGGWRVLAFFFGLVPRPLRDAAYDSVARIRFRLFARPDDACPMVPPPLRSRFLR
jgi:predicted DCC family thiol-disulfide oxidoreductase YuxK